MSSDWGVWRKPAEDMASWRRCLKRRQMCLNIEVKSLRRDFQYRSEIPEGGLFLGHSGHLLNQRSDVWSYAVMPGIEWHSSRINIFGELSFEVWLGTQVNQLEVGWWVSYTQTPVSSRKCQRGTDRPWALRCQRFLQECRLSLLLLCNTVSS